MMSALRRYFISGLLVWLPIWVTLIALKFMVNVLDNTMSMIPKPYQPDALLGFHVPGVGVLITVILILATGVIAANFVGRKFFGAWDALMGRIPLVRSIYTGVKQVSQTLFTPGGQSFRKVVLVEYPREGVWTLAFQTGDTSSEMEKVIGINDLISLYVPTTPNPTSGFLLMVERSKVKEMDMSVDQALKFVISLGVVQPQMKERIN
jgi:uncharacterized membrane protein